MMYNIEPTQSFSASHLLSCPKLRTSPINTPGCKRSSVKNAQLLLTCPELPGLSVATPAAPWVVIDLIKKTQSHPPQTQSGPSCQSCWTLAAGVLVWEKERLRRCHNLQRIRLKAIIIIGVQSVDARNCLLGV